MMGEYDPGYESYIDSLHTDIQEVMDERDQLMAENEKLRELVRHMWRCFLNECADGYAIVSRCGECPYNNDDGRCDFECRMRELGIEVDE